MYEPGDVNFFSPPPGRWNVESFNKTQIARPAKKEEQIALKLHKRTLFAACEKGPFIFQMLREMRCKR
jgi:hypothetical protein